MNEPVQVPAKGLGGAAHVGNRPLPPLDGKLWRLHIPVAANHPGGAAHNSQVLLQVTEHLLLFAAMFRMLSVRAISREGMRTGGPGPADDRAGEASVCTGSWTRTAMPPDRAPSMPTVAASQTPCQPHLTAMACMPGKARPRRRCAWTKSTATPHPKASSRPRLEPPTLMMRIWCRCVLRKCRRRCPTRCARRAGRVRHRHCRRRVALAQPRQGRQR